MKKILILILIAMISFSSCEKDDICDANTATTPRLIIEFFDINNSSVSKNVTNLKVIASDRTEGIVFNTSSTDSKYLTNGSEISIPLKADMDSTTYQFILNYGNDNTAIIDTDEVTFNYTRENVYVSRACGFKTLFTLNHLDPYVQTAVPTSKQKWMTYISVEKSNIANENETHIKVFF